MSTLGTQTRRLFQYLYRNWLPGPDLEEGFLQTLDGFSRLQGHLREDRNLVRLSRQMYSDLAGVVADCPGAGGTGSRFESDSWKSGKDAFSDDGLLAVAEVHEVLHILQIMEIAWINARMEDFDAHPLNRGWVAIFHRWAMMPAFRRLWPVLRADFSRAFIEYCESRFSLRVWYSELKPKPYGAGRLATSSGLTGAGCASPQSGRLRSDRPGPMRIRATRRMVTQQGENVSSEQQPGCGHAGWLAMQRTVRRELEAEWPEVSQSFFDDPDCNVWFVCPSMPLFEARDDRLEDAGRPVVSRWELQVPLGFVALLPPGPESVDERDAPGFGHRSCDSKASELRFWVRPQYRFLGVGRHMLDRFARECLRQDHGDCSVYDDNAPLVTRYFVRTGLVRGRGIRRRMQLGFLYEYSFARRDDRPYDEVIPSVDSGKVYPSDWGIDRRQSVSGRETVVSAILETTWGRFFEAACSMSTRPGWLSRDRGHDRG